MQLLLGIFFHTMGGVASGSFYMPFRKVSGWAWESFWLVGGLFSWLLAPWLAAWITLPGYWDIIQSADLTVLQFVYSMGLLWGVGGLTYGLGVRFLGMSLGNSIILGCCAALGALLPAIYYDFYPVEGKTTFTDLLGRPGGRLVLWGVATCLLGIGICGKAGMMKEKLAEQTPQGKMGEFDLAKGLAIALVSGVLSAFFNFGIEGGKPLAVAAVEKGCNPLFQNNVTYVILLWGGLTTNLLWCGQLNYRNKTFGDYVNRSTPIVRNTFFSGLAGTTWFLQFLFYGMGESKLGNGASSWILHMATIILTANCWGIYLKEWKGAPAPVLRTFTLGLCLILASIVLVGIGNAIY